MSIDFLPDEILHSWIPRKHIDGLFKVDGVNPTSFIGRCERLGKPLLKGVAKNPARFKAYDIIERAEADGLSVTPYCAVKALYDIDNLRVQEQELLKERDKLLSDVEGLKHHLKMSIVSKNLTAKTLLREDEIVEGALAIPRVSAVYFLINNSKVVYVGQSVNVFSRINDHVTTKEFDSVSFVPCDTCMLDRLESLYIHYLRPPLNGFTNSKDKRPSAPLSLQELLQIT